MPSPRVSPHFHQPVLFHSCAIVFSALHRKYPCPPCLFLLPFNVSPLSPPSSYYADSDPFLLLFSPSFCYLFHPGRRVLILTVHTVRWEGNYPDQNFLALRSNKYRQGRPIRRITERGGPGESAEKQKGGGDFWSSREEKLDRTIWWDLGVANGVKMFAQTVF